MEAKSAKVAEAAEAKTPGKPNAAEVNEGYSMWTGRDERSFSVSGGARARSSRARSFVVTSSSLVRTMGMGAGCSVTNINVCVSGER